MEVVMKMRNAGILFELFALRAVITVPSFQNLHSIDNVLGYIGICFVHGNQYKFCLSGLLTL